jgi:hypothetical protein
VARALGWSEREFVSMVNTTKPCDAMRGPSHAMLDWVAVNPGATAMAPNVPSAVLVGK